MTVDFGRIKTASRGRTTKLTKQIQQGFDLRTTVDEEKLWEIADRTSIEYPRTTGMFGSVRAARVYKTAKDGQRTIGYGKVKHNKEGAEVFPSVDWSLRIQDLGPSFRIHVHYARAQNGKIESVTEMQHWLNEFESQLRLVDPNTEVRMIEEN